MASEQKLQSADDNQPNATTTNGESLNPSNDNERPICCASTSGHKGEPVTHLVTAPPEARREQVQGSTANEGHGLVTGGQQDGGEGDGKQEQERVTSEDASQIEVSENKEEVQVGLLVSLDDNGPSEEERADQGPQVTSEGAAPQVPCGETEVQGTDNGMGSNVTGDKTKAQVTEEETGLKGTGDEKETWTISGETCSQSTGEETGEQVAGKETGPQNPEEDGALQVTITELESEKNRDAQVIDTGVYQNLSAPLSNAGETWIDMLVRTIVTEAAGAGACTGEQATGAQEPVRAADTITEMVEKEHSTLQVTETLTSAEVMLQGAGAAAQVDTDRQVSNDNIDTALHVSGEEPGVPVKAEGVTAIPEQVNEEQTGIDRQVEEAAAPREGSAGAQVTVKGEEVQKDISKNLEAGGQFIAAGEEADRKVTPDLGILPGREGTGDQDQPVACREKEWPSLICTGSEVGTVTEEQGDTQQGSVTQKGPSDGAPEMKEREVIEDGHSPTHETPIEREIRLAMEREMTLRQERGISSPIGQPELVEVRRRTLSVEPVAVPGKERQLAGAQMQREIQLETQREKDLVELGKVMGTYDRGPQQELQERKMIFESLKTEQSEAPITKKQSEPQQQPKPQEAPTSYVTVSSNHVVPVKETKKGPSYAEANGSNVIIIEHSSMLRRSAPGNTFSSAPADSHRSTPADTSSSIRGANPAEISRTNSSGSALPNSDDSPVPPGSPYQLHRSPSPRSLLEREIEEVKERDRELQKQRSSIYGSDDSIGETTQKQVITSDIQSVYQPERPSWGKLEVNWPPNKETAMNGQQQVLDSPRSRRQRNALIQSWESGNPNPKDDE